MSIIRQKRKELRYSQTEIGQMVGVTQGAVSQWEIGNSVPGPDQIFRLSEILSIPVERILSDYVSENGSTHDAA